MKPLYFGCWNDVGHLLYDQHGQYVRREVLDLLVAIGIDGAFRPTTCKEHGAGQFTWLGNITILSIHDYSVDSRPGSHSTFVLPGNLQFSEAKDAAAKAFPHVMKRFERVWREM